jgi:hypothetical protein
VDRVGRVITDRRAASVAIALVVRRVLVIAMVGATVVGRRVIAMVVDVIAEVVIVVAAIAISVTTTAVDAAVAAGASSFFTGPPELSAACGAADPV